MGTLLYLGECYEQMGKLASAWATFKEAFYAASSGHDRARRDTARERVTALEPRLPYLTVEVTEPVAGTKVAREGEAVGPALYGTPVPTDPGRLTITASAPQHQSWSESVELAEGARVTVAVPRLQPAAAAPATPAAGAVQPATPGPAPAPTADSGDKARDGSSALPAWIAIGVGGAGLIVGGITYLAASGQQSDLDTAGCVEGRCPPRLEADVDSYNTLATVSTVATIAGVACGAAGVTLVLLSSGSEEQGARSAVELRVAGSGAQLRGAF